jgi:hypothetical protein
MGAEIKRYVVVYLSARGDHVVSRTEASSPREAERSLKSLLGPRVPIVSIEEESVQ